MVRGRNANDGRDRTQAIIVERWDAASRDAARRSEQRWMNRLGGVDNLNDRRNEIRRSLWEESNISDAQYRSVIDGLRFGFSTNGR